MSIETPCAYPHSEHEVRSKTALLLTQQKYVFDLTKWNLRIPKPLNGQIANRLFALTKNQTFGAIPHVGIGIVGSELSKLGYVVDFGDLCNPHDIARAKEYGFTGVSFLDISYDRVVELIEQGLLDLDSTVFGGLGATNLEPKLRARFPDISVMAGEVEGMMPQIIADFKAGKLKPKYQRDSPVDMSQAGNEPYMDPKLTYRNHKLFRDSLIQGIEAGRGCFYSCDFCPTAGDNPRPKPLDVVKKELDFLQKRLGRVLIFVDQNLLAYPHDYLIQLFDYVNEKGILWAGEGTIIDAFVDRRSDTLQFDDMLMKTMAKNCLSFLVGIEDLTGKIRGAGKMSLLQANFKDIVAKTRKYRFPLVYSFVYGTDAQRFPDVFASTVRAVRELDITILPHIATPRAGTRWEERLVEEGRMPTQFSSLRLNQRDDIVHKPLLMESEEVLAGFTWLCQQVFNPQLIVKRFAKNLTECGPRYAFGLLVLELNGFTRNMALTEKHGHLLRKYSSKLHL